MQGFAGFPRGRFFSFFFAALAGSGISCLLALVFFRALTRDGELAFFLALDVAEDLAGRAAAQTFIGFRSIGILCIRPANIAALRLRTPITALVGKIPEMQRAALFPPVLQPAERDDRQHDECDDAEANVEHAMAAQ